MTEENAFELTGDQFFITSTKNFALIVDGEVAGNYQIPVILGTEKMIAIFQSNPIIIETEDKIAEGSTWDGQTFTPPVE
jgi:hypothetical protein